MAGKEGGKLSEWEGERKVEREREGGRKFEREGEREELRVGEVNINSNLCEERGSGCEQSEG